MIRAGRATFGTSLAPRCWAHALRRVASGSCDSRGAQQHGRLFVYRAVSQTSRRVKDLKSDLNRTTGAAAITRFVAGTFVATEPETPARSEFLSAERQGSRCHGASLSSELPQIHGHQRETAV